MSSKETFTFRFIFLSFLFILGMIAGIYVHKITPKNTLEKEKPKKVGFNYEGIMLPMVSLNEASGDNFSIPIFNKDGYRSLELKADKVLWKKDGPVELTNPVLYEFDIDGKTVLTQTNGDFGKILIDTETKQLQDVAICGNVKIFRIVKEEPKEEVKEENNEEPKEKNE